MPKKGACTQIPATLKLLPLVAIASCSGWQGTTDEYCQRDEGGTFTETKLAIENEKDGEFTISSITESVSKKSWKGGFSSCETHEVSRTNVSDQYKIDILECTEGPDSAVIVERTIQSGNTFQTSVPLNSEEKFIAWKTSGTCTSQYPWIIFEKIVSGEARFLDAPYETNKCYLEFENIYVIGKALGAKSRSCDWKR